MKKESIKKTKVSMKHRGIRFSDDDWKELAKIAKKEGVYISDVVRHASQRFIVGYDKQPN